MHIYNCAERNALNFISVTHSMCCVHRNSSVSTKKLTAFFETTLWRIFFTILRSQATLLIWINHVNLIFSLFFIMRNNTSQLFLKKNQLNCQYSNKCIMQIFLADYFLYAELTQSGYDEVAGRTNRFGWFHIRASQRSTKRNRNR